MRFMIIIQATAVSEQGCMPTAALMTAMARYHEELARAGVLLDASGLQPSAKGWRVGYSASDTRTVTDGPFTETKELVAGFWIIQVKSREEAVEWARRVPLNEGEEIELRKVAEMGDFQDVGGEVREALEREQAWRDANPQAPLTR